MKSLTFLPLSLLCAVTSFHIAGCASAADGVSTKPAMQKSVSAPVVVERAGDKYILPKGAGTKDGSSWANAMDASAGGLQPGWDALQPGQTLWVGSGEYSNVQLKIQAGGEAGKLKTLAGKDTGGGAPVFAGTFDKKNPSKSGTTFISLSDGADYWGVQDIQIRDYKVGISSSAGGHEGALIRNFDVTGCREGISLVGGGTPDKPELSTHDVEISDCEFTHFTKRGIRMKQGNYDIRISNCVADAGGKTWATEPFQIGFSVEGDDAARKGGKPGVHEHDITFTNCVALSSYNNAGGGYWNADGFCGERGVTNLRFINCMAFDNTDGGWDFKSENITLENCVAIGNKRNYRFWGATTKLINCLGASSVNPGGSGGQTGLWTNGTVTVEKSTFYDSGFSPDDKGKIVVTNSIFARSKERPGTAPLGAKDGLQLVDTVLWDETTGQGENPQLVAPSPLWEGQGDAFNSKKFGPTKGFFNTATNMPAFHRTPFTPGAVIAEKAATEKAAIEAKRAAKTPEQLSLEAKMVPTIENGGFESDLTGWSNAAAPAVAIKTTGAAEGQKYATVTSERHVEVKGKITGLVEAENYILSFKSRGNTSKSARVIVRRDPKSGYLGSTAPSDAKDWTAKTIKFVAPGNEALIEISVRAAGTFDLDDFVVKRAN
jgi:hypothetical protein